MSTTNNRRSARRSNIDNKKFVTLDCGKNNATFFDGITVKTISHKQLFDLPQKYPNHTFVGEDAHFGVPRNLTSLAQPLTKRELKTLYNECERYNVDLGLFPQKSTPRAKLYAGLEKSDEDDPKAIYKLLSDFPKIQLKNPKYEFDVSPVRKEGYKMKHDLNRRLNVARRQDYTDSNSRWLKDNIEELTGRISEQAKDCFGLTDESRRKVANKTPGALVGQMKLNKVNFPQLYSILSTLQGEIDFDGENADITTTRLIRNESTGDLPSWKFAKKHLFCMSPHHQKGGVARSNLYYQGKRYYIIRKAKDHEINLKRKHRGEFSREEDQSFVFYRKIYVNSIREVFNAFRSMIKEGQ